jgi:hypothetical protein
VLSIVDIDEEDFYSHQILRDDNCLDFENDLDSVNDEVVVVVVVVVVAVAVAVAMGVSSHPIVGVRKEQPILQAPFIFSIPSLSSEEKSFTSLLFSYRNST